MTDRNNNNKAVAAFSESANAQQAAAEKIIAVLVGDAPREQNADTGYGVTQAQIKRAGRALAGQYCFAIMVDEEGAPMALITPTRFFEKNGCCDDQSGPIHHLLPGCAEAMESTWEFCNPAVRTPEDAFQELTSLGFCWNKSFQDMADGAATTPVLPQLKKGPAR